MPKEEPTRRKRGRPKGSKTKNKKPLDPFKSMKIRVPTLEELKTKEGMDNFLHEVILYSLTGKLGKFQIDGINKTVKEIRENSKSLDGVSTKIESLVEQVEDIKRVQTSGQKPPLLEEQKTEDLPLVQSIEDLASKAN